MRKMEIKSQDTEENEKQKLDNWRRFAVYYHILNNDFASEQFINQIQKYSPNPIELISKNNQQPTIEQIQIDMMKYALDEDKGITKFVFLGHDTIPLYNFEYTYNQMMNHNMSMIDIQQSDDHLQLNSNYFVLTRSHAQILVAKSQQPGDVLSKINLQEVWNIGVTYQTFMGNSKHKKYSGQINEYDIQTARISGALILRGLETNFGLGNSLTMKILGFEEEHIFFPITNFRKKPISFKSYKNSLEINSLSECSVIIQNRESKCQEEDQKYNGKQKKKLAFMFMIYDTMEQPFLWNKFFEEADPEHFTIYYHVARNEDRLGILSIYQIKQCWWGERGLANVTAKIIEEAFQDPLNEKFILVSQACIPIYSFKTIYENLMSLQDFSIIQMSDIQNFYGNRKYAFTRLINIYEKHILIKHHQWAILKRSHAEVVINEYEKFIVKFEQTMTTTQTFPEEGMLTIILAEKNLMHEIWNTMSTFSTWDQRPLNYNNFTVSDIYDARKAGSLFFRKITREAYITPDLISIILEKQDLKQAIGEKFYIDNYQ
eukprot:403362727